MNKDQQRRDTRPVTSGAAAVTVGAAGGVTGAAAAGAAAGGITGPVGAVVGAAAGAIVGALATKGMAYVDRNAEDRYWCDNFGACEYARVGTYDDYGPAFAHGVDAYARHPEQEFRDLESDLGRAWVFARGRSSLDSEQARPAARDAWQRLRDRTTRQVPVEDVNRNAG